MCIRDRGNGGADLAIQRTTTMNSAAESEVNITRRLTKILTGSVNEPDRVEVDYTNCAPMGGDRPDVYKRQTLQLYHEPQQERRLRVNDVVWFLFFPTFKVHREENFLKCLFLF